MMRRNRSDLAGGAGPMGEEAMGLKPCAAVLLSLGVALAAGLLPAAAQDAPGEGAGGAMPQAGPLPAPAPGPEDASGYPASARKDYILACVTVNGGSEAARASCGCSMDVIASILPYERYDQADTILRMRRMAGGYLAGEFRVQSTNQTLDALREAQAEGEVRCF